MRLGLRESGVELLKEPLSSDTPGNSVFLSHKKEDMKCIFLSKLTDIERSDDGTFILYQSLSHCKATKLDKFENATFFIGIGLPSPVKQHFREPKTELFENALHSR